jgi:hypothetical protein
MELTQKVRLTAPKRDSRSYDLAILLGYSAFAILLMVAIYFAASGPGTTTADLATMGAFP